MLWWAAGCAIPPPLASEPGGGSDEDLADAAATQVGAECTAGTLERVGGVAFPAPGESEAPVDSRVVFVSREAEPDLELSADGVEVPFDITVWPAPSGPVLVLAPTAELVPETGYVVVATDPTLVFGAVYSPFETSGEPAGPAGSVEVRSVVAGPWDQGARRLTVHLSVAVDEPSLVRLHPEPCGDPADGVLGVVAVGADGLLTMDALDLEDDGPDCVCAVVTSAAGVDGTPSEALCP